MKKLLIVALLVAGCASMKWIPTKWELGMSLGEFKKNNDKIVLHYASLDSSVYSRGDAYLHMHHRPYHWYIFVDGKLTEVKRGKYKPRPQPQKVEVEVKEKKVFVPPNPYK